MTRGVVSMRALALALLVLMLCILEGSTSADAWRPKGMHPRRHRHKRKGMRFSRAVVRTRFVGMNLGDGCSLSVAQLGEYAASLGVTRVKLFHSVASDLATLSKFKVMAGLQNDQLQYFADPAAGYQNSVQYVNEMIVPNPHVYSVAVGNEPFGQWHNKKFDALVLASMNNLDEALRKAGLGREVELVVLVDFASMYRDDFPAIITPILTFLQSKGYPFVVNPYPDWPCNKDPIDITFCLGNASAVSSPGAPTSMLAAQVEQAMIVIGKLGFDRVEVQVGETGWPTGDGNRLSTFENQQTFIQGVIDYVRQGGVASYIFQLQDGYSDSFGLLKNPSGEPKFPLPTFF